jgi:diguanylate cyclase (GGDEF)-like protein
MTAAVIRCQGLCIAFVTLHDAKRRTSHLNQLVGFAAVYVPQMAHMHMLYKIARVLRFTQVAALLLVVVMGIALYAVLMQYKAAVRWVDHTHEVLDQIDQVRTGALRAGTWLRSYGMYPSEAMLPRIKASAASAMQAALELRTLTADDPVQSVRVQVLTKALDEVLSIYLVSADIAQQHGPAVLREMTIAQVRLDITAELRSVLDQMEATERNLLQTRRAVEQQHLAMTEKLLLAIGGAFVATVLWTMRYSGQLIRLGQQEVRQLRGEALLDPLTGLLNRRGLHKQLANMGMGSAGVATAAVLVFDLNDFKLVNDRHSHAAGDQVLRTIAQRLQEQCRSGDAVARVGGDEFVAVLSSVASRQEAVVVAQRICSHMQCPIQLTEDINVCVSVAVGVAMLHEDGEDMDVLLHAADKRMYMAKGAVKTQGRAVAEAADEPALG